MPENLHIINIACIFVLLINNQNTQVMTRYIDFELSDPSENVAWNGTGELHRHADGRNVAVYVHGIGTRHENEVSADTADYLESIAGTEEGRAAIIHAAMGRLY